MKPPTKRLKVSRPDSRSPRDAGSRMKEGLFTSELGTRSDEADGMLFQAPTRTLALVDMQRSTHLDVSRKRPQLVRRNAGVHLLPRVPDATVTASVVDVNVDVGSTTLDATVVAAATSDVLVSVSSLGTLTVLAENISSPTDTSAITTNALVSSQAIITSTPPTTPLPSDTSFASSTSTDDQATVLTALSSATSSNSTITSSEPTVTVTATSTLQFSYTNGTFVLSPTTTILSSISDTSTGHRSTLVTSTLSTGRLSSTAVFGSTGPAETSFASGGSAASSNNGPQGGAAATGSSTNSAASASSSSSSGGSSGPGLTPTQQQVVGGVVGGVAGIAFVLLVALVFLRWYRKRLKSQGRLPEQQQDATREITTSGGESFAQMSERSSNVPLAAAMASFGRRLRSQSSNTFATTATGATSTTVPESERGFQRIAGRKIAPVISPGVDQYGGNYGAFEKDMGGPASLSSDQPTQRELAGTSFYRDSGGFYGGKGLTSSTPSPAPTAHSAPIHSRNVSTTRDFAADSPISVTTKPEGFAVLRPSPARTPTTQSPSTSSIKLPIQQIPRLEPEAPPTPALPSYIVAERDAIGRSLASQDGSRVSRASRGSGSRFSERI